MKVGIIGLRPHQIADLEGRNFEHQLLFYRGKTFKKEHLEAFSREPEVIVAATRGLPNNVPQQLPSEKIRFANGSVSSVIRQIESLPIEKKSEDVAKTECGTMVGTNSTPSGVNYGTLPKVPRWPLASLQSVSTVKPVQQDVTSNKPLVYVKPGDDEVMMQKPCEDGRMDFSILQAAKVGDVVRYMRPRGIATALWEQRYVAVRSYYRKYFKLNLECHFFDTFVDVFITPAKQTFHTYNYSCKDFKAWRKRYTSPMSLKEDYVPRTRDISPAVTEDSHATSEPPVETSTVTEPVTDTSMAMEANVTSIHRSFWRRVFLIDMDCGGTVEEASTKADAALVEYRKRFE